MMPGERLRKRSGITGCILGESSQALGFASFCQAKEDTTLLLVTENLTLSNPFREEARPPNCTELFARKDVRNPSPSGLPLGREAARVFLRAFADAEGHAYGKVQFRACWGIFDVFFLQTNTYSLRKVKE